MPKPLVVDASLTLRMLLPGPDQDRVREQFGLWYGEGIALHAPTLWCYEVTSALCKAVYLKALTPSEGRRALALANALEVATVGPDAGQAERAYDWTLRLGRIAAYDSFYLALGEALACELWTADKRLHGAAALPWVRLM